MSYRLRTSTDFHTPCTGGIITLGFDSSYPWFNYEFKYTRHPLWKNQTLKASVTIFKIDLEIYLRTT